MHFQYKDCPEPIEGRKYCFKLIARKSITLVMYPWRLNTIHYRDTYVYI